MIAPSVFDFLLLISHVFATFVPMGRGVDWAAQDVTQLRQWLEEGRKPREMRAWRPDWSLESIKTKIKHLRQCAPDESRPLKRRRTSEVVAEIETAVTETPRQTLSVPRRHSSLDMSRSTLWRALHEDLQARCFKPARAPRWTTENRLARLNFCRDVLQRVGVLSIRGKRHLKPLDMTRVVFSDEKFFRWNYQGPAQNSPIWVVGAHRRPARQADLDPDVCINEHSQRNPGTMMGAAMANGIVFPPCFIEEGVRINAECYSRMLDCMARLGTDTSSWWWQEDTAPSDTSRRTKAFMKERDIQLLTWRRAPVHVPTGTSCARCPISTQKPLNRRAPLGSLTVLLRLSVSLSLLSSHIIISISIIHSPSSSAAASSHHSSSPFLQFSLFEWMIFIFNALSNKIYHFHTVFMQLFTSSEPPVDLKTIPNMRS